MGGVEGRGGGGQETKPAELWRLSSPAASSSSRPAGMCVFGRVLEAALLSAAHPAPQTRQSCRPAAEWEVRIPQKKPFSLNSTSITQC